MSFTGWLVAGILVTIAITIVAVRHQKKFAARRNQSVPTVPTDELETIEATAPPVNDVTQLGHGVTLIMPRVASVKMPHNLGRGAGQYRLAIRTLFADSFGLNPEALAEQDAIWDEWRATKCSDEPRNLLELLKSDVADGFKARAMTILLVPSVRFSPFSWKDDHDNDWNYHFMGTVDIASLPEKVRSFVIELVAMSVDAILASDFNEKLYETLFGYNKYILQILSLLPEEDEKAAEMYGRYQLNDPIGFSGMEDASGWNPFEALMTSAVPERWKRLADVAMRERIVAEESGAVNPRYDWERALRCYRSHIMTRLYTQNPWSTELFASQIEFLLGLEATREFDLVDNWKVQEVLNLLDGEERHALRHRLARRVVLETVGEHRGFRVYSNETRAAAHAMMDKFGSEDEELRSKLVDLLLEGEKKLREQAQSAADHEAEVDSVLKKMA